MKFKHNVEYTLQDNKGYLMAIDQSTSFKTIINFVGDYTLDPIDIGLLYMVLEDEGIGYICIVKTTGRAITLGYDIESKLKELKLEIED